MKHVSAFNMPIDDETELRLHEERYAPEYFALIDQNREHLRQWMPWLDYEQSVADTAAYIRSTLQQFAHNEGFQCGIWHQDKIVGSIGFHALEWNNRKVEMGYWISQFYEGKGLVTKAAGAMLNYAFHVYKLNKVEIRCATGNVRSCAIPKRLGFQQEGIIRQAEWLYDHFVDLMIYGLLANEWNEQEH
jgi:ribosomal-protein-serine acetyltransferase